MCLKLIKSIISNNAQIVNCEIRDVLKDTYSFLNMYRPILNSAKDFRLKVGVDGLIQMPPRFIMQFNGLNVAIKKFNV